MPDLPVALQRLVVLARQATGDPWGRDLPGMAGGGRAVAAGDEPVAAVGSGVRAGAAAVVLYGAALPAGGLGLDEGVPVPVVSVPAAPALAALEAEGFAMRGRFTPAAAAEEWCERRLLALCVILLASLGTSAMLADKALVAARSYRRLPSPRACAI